MGHPKGQASTTPQFPRERSKGGIRGLAAAGQSWVGAAQAEGSDDGDRQMVKVLSAVLTDGLTAVEAACAEALAGGVHSADVVLNILARHRDPGPAATILTPRRCGCGTRRSPIARAMTGFAGSADGTHRYSRADVEAQALRHALISAWDKSKTVSRAKVNCPAA